MVKIAESCSVWVNIMTVAQECLPKPDVTPHSGRVNTLIEERQGRPVQAAHRPCPTDLARSNADPAVRGSVHGIVRAADEPLRSSISAVAPGLHSAVLS